VAAAAVPAALARALAAMVARATVVAKVVAKVGQLQARVPPRMAEQRQVHFNTQLHVGQGAISLATAGAVLSRNASLGVGSSCNTVGRHLNGLFCAGNNLLHVDAAVSGLVTVNGHVAVVVHVEMPKVLVSGAVTVAVILQAAANGLSREARA